MAIKKAFLSGVSEVQYNNGWNGQLDGIGFIINNETYIAYFNPDDGWRSYSCFEKDNNVKVTNKFPKQEVLIDWEYVDYDNGEIKGVVIYNLYMEVILKAVTDYSDGWYPCAIFEYFPQNLPINKKRLGEKFNLEKYVLNPNKYKVLYKGGKEIYDIMKMPLESIMIFIDDLTMIEKPMN